MERVWIDWSRPFLPEATTWLVDLADERADGEATVDLAATWCVTPGARAGRVLLGLLAGACDRRGVELLPPRVVTPGVLVRELLECDVPVATAEECRHAWIRTLQGDDDLRALLPERPRQDDLLTWHALARRIDDLHEQLAGEQLDFATALDRAERLELFAESDRWRTLVAAARRYRTRLESCGLVDPRDWARDALAAGAFRASFAGGGDIVLCAVTELNGRQRAVLEKIPAGVTTLVHAPESVADRFDDFGCPVPEAWAEASLPVTDEQIVVAENPADQAQTLLRCFETFGDELHAGDITIGVGDETLVEPVTRAAAWAGLDVHVAQGTPLARTRPHRLLAAAAAWLRETRFKNLATLVRHPDMEATVLRTERGGDPAGTVAACLTRLDRARTDHLHDRLEDGWRGRADDRAYLGQLVRVVDTLLAPLRADRRPLRDWCEPMLEVLLAVYGDLDVGIAHAENRTTVSACLEIRNAVARHRTAVPASAVPVEAWAAVELFLADVAERRVAPDVRDDQIEMLGWLELHLDSAPNLALAGVNDGAIPEAVHGDLFLPDTLRGVLGLVDNRQRYARDAYLMEAIVRSRRRVVLVAGRVDAVGEPLAPSRLLLATDDETMVRRVRRLCDDETGKRLPLPPVGAPRWGTESAFVVPPLPAGVTPPDHMAVTHFGSYLRCPYRYALEKLLRLRKRRDDARELDPLQFGSLAHRVLHRFGLETAIRDSTDADAIAAFLADALQAEIREQFGDPMPAVRIQASRLEQRLAVFAQKQADLRCEGWVIEDVEWAVAESARLEIPGQDPMRLTGQVDRIDVHEESGARRIIDYKTGEKAKSPYVTHNGSTRTPDGDEPEWTDLQLPLYRHLARQEGIEGDIGLAYIVLPSKREDVGLLPAAWTEPQLASAIEKATEIVRRIRALDFPMNRLAGGPFDTFGRICQTTAFVNAEGAPAGDDGGETA